MSFDSEKWKKAFNSDRRIATYDETIDLFSLRREERSKVLQALLPEVKDADYNILELGAGTGLITKLLATHYPNAKITAVDGAKKMIDLAESKRFFQDNKHRIEWLCTDYSTPTWQKKIVNTFHLVVTVDSLHHLTHKRKIELYKELFNAVIPGGILFVSDHMTSQEPFYKDTQFNLWIEEIEQKMAEKSKITLLKKKLISWAPERIKSLLVPKLKESFIKNLLQEGENPMLLMDHVDSLRESGFVDVTVEYRYASFGIVSAKKREDIQTNE